MNSQPDPGDFPFPLTGGADQSRFLVWLRNHSNFLASRGTLDYLRMVAVLLRGILINNLVVLPTFLMIALAFSLAYGGLLSDWDAQKSPASEEIHKASRALLTAPPETQPEKIQELTAARDRAKSAEALDRGARPLEFFISKTAKFDDTTFWVRWMQTHLLKSTPPFLFTPYALFLAGAWTLLFPIATMFARISGYRKSLSTGSDSSVEMRDLYERTFGFALLLVLAVVLFELLPLAVHFYHQVRERQLAGQVPWNTYLAAAAAGLVALGGSPKLLSMVSGVWETLVKVVIAMVGLSLPLVVVVIVSDFLIYESMPASLDTVPLLFLIYFSIPGLFVLGLLLVTLVGGARRAFSGRDFRNLALLGVGLIVGHIVLAFVLVVVWFLAYQVNSSTLGVVPHILLAVDAVRGTTIWDYADMAPYIVLGCALELWLFCWMAVDVNLTSLHSWYRDRLATAYLLGLTRDTVKISEDVELSELCCYATGSTAPYHLINAALNLQSSKDLSLRDRKSDFFIFSKAYIGGARVGYCRTRSMEQVFPQADLAAAMAISAAAVSPNMGRSTSPAMAPFLTLINIRLGVWVPNPGLLETSVSAGTATGRRKANPSDHTPPGIRFESVFRDELGSIKKRWEQLGERGARRGRAAIDTPTPAHRLAGIGFSGGGIRSATVNLGIAQVLNEAGIFGHFDYMSTVSGGGYLGSSISTLMRYKEKPVSEVAGTVAIVAPHIVTVTTESGEACRYSYSKDAELAVADGDQVGVGTRLIRRAGSPPQGETSPRAQNSFGSRFRWRVRPRALLHEMTMRLNERARWVNVSDGGQIENLATMELLRRRCKFIVIGDGECDPHHRFNGLATLMRTARLDLGIEIEIDLDALRLDPASRQSASHFAIGRIAYPGEREPTEYGYLLYLKSSYTGREDAVITEYRQRNEAFPHESTADQFFNEGQFEAYRSLGEDIGRATVSELAQGQPIGEAFADFADFEKRFEAAWERALTRQARPSRPESAASQPHVA